MRGARTATVIAASLLVFLVVACGGDSHEKASEEVRREVERFFAVMSGVKDEAGARAAGAEIDEIIANLDGLAQRYEAMGEPDEETRKKIAEQMARFSDEKQKEYGSGGGEFGQAGPEVIAIMMDYMKRFSEVAGRMPPYVFE